MGLPLAALLGTAADRWLLALAVAALAVVVGASIARRRARALGGDADETRRGTRRRAGALLAVGPIAGFVVAPGAGDHVAIAALGAAVLGGLGALAERRRASDRLIAGSVACAAAVAVAVGVRFEPTGVGVFDVVGAFLVVFVVTFAIDGLGNSDGLVPGLGAVAALAFLALGGFAEQYGLANGAAGLLGASVAFLAYSVPPASLFAGRGGRLATGFALGVFACSLDTVPGPPANLWIGVSLVAIPLLDVTIVVVDRAQRRRAVLVDRHDHLVNRIAAYGASRFEAVAILVAAQAVIVVLAVLAGRGVLPTLLVVVVVVLVVGSLGGYALRAPLERMSPPGLRPRVRWVIAGVCGVLALGIVPLVVDVPDIADTMERGRDAASRGLAAARAGDAAEAEIQFRRATGYFEEARDRLDSVRYEPARVVPGVASNLRAARALAAVGADLASNGAAVTATVVPEALTVRDGRVPVEEVERVTPALERGTATLDRSLARLREIEDEPYLLGPIRDAIASIRPELRRGAREARNTAAAVRLAPAILGATDGPRRYLLVVQNPAENRGTGGLIGSYGVLTAEDGELFVSPLERTGVWNANAATSGAAAFDAPDDYRKRYGQFQPETHLQAVNMSPDFPTVGGVLASLAPEAGVGDVDGVLAVDPKGLAALLRLTGPVTVPGWPTEVTADNVVDVTLRDAYAEFARTPERAEFLGEVAQAVVDEATSGVLGEPATVARELGRAARQGHLALWFTRPEEQRLAESVRAAGALARGYDVLHVTEANVAANKIDYYLDQDLDYRLEVRPDSAGRAATAAGSLTVRVRNTAPPTGLPQIVAGPFEGASPGEFVEGESVSYVSVYTPLGLEGARLDGDPVPMTGGDELGLRVYSTIVRTLAEQERTLTLDLAGQLRMARNGWYELAVGSQPRVSDARARISISVPEGYRITETRGVQRVLGRRATGIVSLAGPTTVRVRIEADPGGFLSRLDRGS